MAKLRVHNYSMSLDGFVAGPDQSLEDPMGVGGHAVHQWIFATPFGREMLGRDLGDAVRTIDDDFLERGVDGIGATIMGRNMFGPVRGDWGDDQWRGWWDANPPFHHPVFVLTHHAHEPMEMEGGTTFFFVTDGIESALEQATEAAGDQDIRLGGGASTVRQYLEAGLVDELHLPVSPVLLGAGERLFTGDAHQLDGYDVEIVTSPAVAHYTFTRR